MKTRSGRASAHDTGLYTPREVAALFRVGNKTIARWARAGKLHCVYTLGGHRRYPVAEVTRLVAEMHRQSGA